MDTLLIGLTITNVLTSIACLAFWRMIVKGAEKYRSDVDRMIAAMQSFNEDDSDAPL